MVTRLGQPVQDYAGAAVCNVWGTTVNYYNNFGAAALNSFDGDLHGVYPQAAIGAPKTTMFYPWNRVQPGQGDGGNAVWTDFVPSYPANALARASGISAYGIQQNRQSNGLPGVLGLEIPIPAWVGPDTEHIVVVHVVQARVGPLASALVGGVIGPKAPVGTNLLPSWDDSVGALRSDWYVDNADTYEIAFPVSWMIRDAITFYGWTPPEAASFSFTTWRQRDGWQGRPYSTPEYVMVQDCWWEQGPVEQPNTEPAPLRQRQRDDGLGGSALRARGASSRQRSVRQRAYL